MTAFNLAELRELVRNSGDYQNVRRFSPAFLNEILQRTFGKFWEAIAQTHQGWWDTEGNISTVASQKYIALPSDCWRVQAIDLLEGSEWTPLNQVSVHDRLRYGTQTDQPDAYYTSARGVELFPTPNTVYTLRVTYTPRAPALDEVTQREWYNGWEEYMIEGAKLEIARRERMPLGDHERAVASALARITSGAGERRQQEPEYIRLYDYDQLDVDEYRKG